MRQLLLGFLLLAAPALAWQAHDHPDPPAAASVTAVPAAVPSNFAVPEMLEPAWGTGAIPSSNAPDVVGAFRFLCSAGHLGYDDPIVYPGQPGKSHLHQFFGNLKVDANSTYESLRTTGDSSCMNPLNRSGYWIPAMMRADGKVVKPQVVSIYYKRFPKGSPYCTKRGNECVELPRGLRFIFGYNMLSADGLPKTGGGGYFTCSRNNQPVPGVPAAGVTLAELSGCPSGGLIGVIIGAPHCWDGVRLDSPDHRSHMADVTHDTQTGEDFCPKSHPKIVPSFILQAFYPVDETMTGWTLSSDMGKPAGSTLHADWWGAWDDEVMAKWHANCIDKLLNCDTGNLGNGEQLKPLAAVPTQLVVDAPTR